METKITNIKSAGIKKKNFKVLIIDDEPELLESVCELATLLGYDVLSADTVEKAESLIPKCHGILSDVNMPGKDKLSQLLKVAQERGQAVIRFSAENQGTLSNFMLAKPFTKKELKDSLEYLEMFAGMNLPDVA